MRISITHILFLCAFAALTSCDNHKSEAEKNKEYEDQKKKIFRLLTKVHIVQLDGYDLVTRMIVPNVYKFYSYASITPIYYPMPYGVTEACFIFMSERIQINDIGVCKEKELIVNIKRGSYPAVNPDSTPFPKNYIDPNNRAENIHTIEVKTDGVHKTYCLNGPKPGNWFAVAYGKWKDPKNDLVGQDGLVADCHTVLCTSLQVKKIENITLTDCYSGLQLNYSDTPNYYKCIATSNPDPIQFNITVIDTTSDSKPLLVTLNALSFPTDKDYLVSCTFDPKLKNTQTIIFVPNPDSWHYIHISQPQGNISQYANCESYATRSELESLENHTVIDLMRDDKARFFRFEYGLETTDMQEDTTSLVTLSSDTVKTVKFNINDFHDVGGNMVIEMGLLMEAKYYGGYKRVSEGARYSFTEKDQFLKVVVCLNVGFSSLPLPTGNCQYNDRVQPALFVLNSTDSLSIYDKVTIPYPEGGTWFLTMRLFCDEVVCPCRTSPNGDEYYVEISAIDKKENISGMVRNTRLGVTKCNMTTVLSISSDRCINSQCMNKGVCSLTGVTGLVISYCKCLTGYAGWDCSDDSRMDSYAALITSVLLLTLSNLLFIFSAYTAIIRHYYTEAVMFICTMVASTFYHACDVPLPVQFCIADISLLQYVDFFCGIMSFWVALLAMSVVPDYVRSTLYLIGALGISLLTSWNMQNVMSFLIPVVIGVTILAVSWGIDYKRQRVWRFSKSFYTRHLPLGLFLVAIGLICFTALQTEQNYKYVHSIWHMIVAASVAFLLPDCKRGKPAHPFLPSKGTDVINRTDSE